MSSPRAPLYNRDAKGKRRMDLVDSRLSLLNYGGNQPAILSSWDGALSVFRTDATCEVEYIKNNTADKETPVREFKQVMKGFWSLISAIYSSR